MFLYFFFQAEDGIRDADVTGVQTCALPICADRVEHPRLHLAPDAGRPEVVLPGPVDRRHRHARGRERRRSEERRVGKECRSRWSPYHEKKNIKKVKVKVKLLSETSHVLMLI